MELKEWASGFVEYKHNNIEDIKVRENELIVKSNNIEKTFVIQEKLKSIREGTYIFALNSSENIEYLLNNWEEIIKKNVTFYFVNPLKNDYWALKPTLHNRVIDKKDLKKGIISLFEGVERL